MRYTAWLNAAPYDKKKPLPEGFKPPTRLEVMQADRKDPSYQPAMPDVAPYTHLVGYLWDAGPVLPGAAGPVPLTHGELRAWQENTGIRLTPWEARTLRRLSAEYVAESSRASEPDCPSPVAPIFTDEDRDAVSNKIQNAMRARITAQPQNGAPA